MLQPCLLALAFHEEKQLRNPRGSTQSIFRLIWVSTSLEAELGLSLMKNASAKYLDYWAALDARSRCRRLPHCRAPLKLERVKEITSITRAWSFNVRLSHQLRSPGPVQRWTTGEDGSARTFSRFPARLVVEKARGSGRNWLRTFGSSSWNYLWYPLEVG